MRSALRPSRWRLGTGSLWVAVVLAGFLFLTSLTSLPPNDFWWHLKIGEIVYTTHTIPTTNIFAWSLPADQPYIYAAWLGEWALYVIYRWGGVALVTFFRTLIVLVTFYLAAAEAHRRSRSWRIAAFALAPACLMSLNNLIIRPQLWSLLPLVLVVFLMRRFADGDLRWGWLLACPLLMVLWVNAHGAFVLGIVVGGATTVGEFVTGWRKRCASAWWRKPVWLALVTMLMAFATLVNPRGLGVVGYVQNIMTDPPSQGLIVEWQSPTPHGVANAVFYVSILLFLVVFAYGRRAPRIGDTLLLLALLWLAWSGQRYVIWYALVSTPIFAEAVAALNLPFLSSPSRYSWFNTTLALLLFGSTVIVQPWWVDRLPLQETYWSQVHRRTEIGPLLDTSTPLGAAEYLRQHPGGKLFNEMGYGSYLIWALPDQGVFVDPRVELYPYEQWLDYIRIGRGVRYNELLEDYGADRILLDLKIQEELAGLLATDPLWELEYGDTRSQVWVRARTAASDGG